MPASYLLLTRFVPHAHTLGTQSYYAMPIVSSATPASGPIGGSTLVTVSGSKMDLGARMRCRFGSELREPTASSCAPSTATFSNLDSDCRYGDQVIIPPVSPLSCHLSCHLSSPLSSHLASHLSSRLSSHLSSLLSYH